MIIEDHLKAADGGYEIRGWGFEKLAADPVTNLFVGRTYFNTVSNRMRTYNGTTWDEAGAGAGTGDVTQASNSSASGKLKVSAGADKSITDYAGSDGLIKTASGVASTASAGTDYVTAGSTNTFTNKTFDANGTGNSISNLETADLASGVLNTSSTLSGATGTQLPSALAVSQAIASAITGLAKPMGGIDASTNPNYPAANAGEYYRITVAGLIGGASGLPVQVGDEIFCFVTSAAGTQAAVGANWTVVQTNVDQATESVLGLVALATNAEALAKSNTTKAVVPSALVGFTQSKTFTFGDGTTTTYTLTHNLGTKAVSVTVRDASTDEVVYPRIVAATVNTVTVGPYLVAPTTDSRIATVIG